MARSPYDLADARAPGDRRPRVDADRRHRLRRPARPHRPAAETGRRPRRVDGPPRLRGRQRRLLAAAGAVLDPVGDLLRLPGGGLAGGDRRRPWLHRPRRRPYPRPLGRLPLRLTAGLDPRRRRRGRGGGRRGRGAGRGGPGAPELRPRPRRRRRLGPLGCLRARGRRRRGDDRPLAGARPPRLRRARAADPAGDGGGDRGALRPAPDVAPRRPAAALRSPPSLRPAASPTSPGPPSRSAASPSAAAS